jgi:hypothetical protein
MKTKKDHNKKDDDKTQRDGRGERESTETTRTAKQTDRQAADRQTRQLFCGYGKTRCREREREDQNCLIIIISLLLLL